MHKDLPTTWEEDEYICTRTTAWSAPGCHAGCGIICYVNKETGKLEKVEGRSRAPIQPRAHLPALCGAARCGEQRGAFAASHEARPGEARRPRCMGADQLGRGARSCARHHDRARREVRQAHAADVLRNRARHSLAISAPCLRDGDSSRRKLLLRPCMLDAETHVLQREHGRIHDAGLLRMSRGSL